MGQNKIFLRFGSTNASSPARLLAHGADGNPRLGNAPKALHFLRRVAGIDALEIAGVQHAAIPERLESVTPAAGNQMGDMPDRGGVNIQRLSTTAAGKLGEWIELGGSFQEGSGSERGYSSHVTAGESDRRSVWLKVEEIK